jgi:single-stranded-DNA-specific exonuclease
MLDEILGVNYADEFLDLVALGMIADMVDMRALETRYLTIKGLDNVKNLFMKALIEKQSFSMRGEITPTTIGFYIAPLINGTIRAGTDEEKEVVFKSLLEKYQTQKIQSTKRGAKEGDMEMFIEYGSRIVTNVKARQNRVRDDATKDIESIITFDRLHENKIIPVVVENSVDKNLSGLIANKLMSKYQRPVMILRRTKDGMIEGSARGYEKSDLADFKTFLNNSGLVEYAEGHANAFGVGLKEESLVSLIDHANSSLEHIDFSPKFMVDYIYETNNLTSQDVLSVAGMKSLWGKGFDEALFCIKGLRLKKADVTLLSPDRSPTLKFESKGITYIKFGSSKEEYSSLLSEGYIELDLIGKFSMNEWQGEISPQVQIQDYKIVNNVKYYF